MREREARHHLQELRRFFPVVALIGPRQAGKTTLARAEFPDKPYQSLENPDVRWQAEADPRGFLARFPEGAILDEVQRVPSLFSYLQQIVDDAPSPGRWVLTGSHQFGLRGHLSQSLAGRVGLVHLLPFTTREWYGASPAGLDALLHRGLFPPVLDRDIPARIWYPQYVATYVERDVREILPVRDIGAFSRFVRMCASRCGQLVNLSSLGADCGITHNTAHAWIDVLEASYIVTLLRPWHENFGKRLIKTPKLYFTDTGLLCWLLGIESPEHLSTHAQRGAVFENWAVAESIKRFRNRGEEPNLHFWRDQAGLEIDLLHVRESRLHAIEIKSGATLAADWFKGLRRFADLAGDSLARRTLLYGGTESHLQQGVEVRAWNSDWLDGF